MSTYLLTWNPERSPEDLEEVSDEIDYRGSSDGRWSCGNTKRIVAGDRLFLLRQGTDDPGLIGSATATGRVYKDEPWENDLRHSKRDALYVPLRWDFMSLDAIVTRGELRFQPFNTVHWSSQASGISINPVAARALESLWSTRTEQYNARKKRARKVPAQKIEKWFDLDARYEAYRRREQALIRHALLGGRETAICAFCGQEFPVDLIVAAHIKRRADCTKREKRDYQNNVILLCSFGCDDVFERGYLVAVNGRLADGPRKPTPAVATKVSYLRGKSIACWTQRSARYFDAHRQRVSNTIQIERVVSRNG